MRPLNFCLIMVFLSPFLCNGDQIRPVKAKGTNFSILNCKLGEKFIPWIEKITPWNFVSLNKGIIRLCKKNPDSKGIMLPTFLCLWSPHCTALHCTALQCIVVCWCWELRTTGSTCPSPLLMQMRTWNREYCLVLGPCRDISNNSLTSGRIGTILAKVPT